MDQTHIAILSVLPVFWFLSPVLDAFCPLDLNSGRSKQFESIVREAFNVDG